MHNFDNESQSYVMVFYYTNKGCDMDKCKIIVQKVHDNKSYKKIKQII